MSKSTENPENSSAGITATIADHPTDLLKCQMTCISTHMTDFSVQQFSPAYGVEMLLDSNLSKLDEGLNDGIFAGFAFYTVVGLWFVMIVGMIWGKMKDNQSKKMRKIKKNAINLGDHLYLNKYGEGNQETDTPVIKLKKKKKKKSKYDDPMNDSGRLEIMAGMGYGQGAPRQPGDTDAFSSKPNSKERLNRNPKMHKGDKVQPFDASQFEGGEFETDEEHHKKKNKRDPQKITKCRLFMHGIKNQHRLFSLVFLFNQRLSRPSRVMILIATVFSMFFTNGMFFEEEEEDGGEFSFNFAEIFWIALWSFLLTKPLIIFCAWLMKFRIKTAPEEKLQSNEAKKERSRKRRMGIPQTMDELRAAERGPEVDYDRTQCESIKYWFGFFIIMGFIAACSYMCLAFSSAFGVKNTQKWGITFAMSLG